MGANQSTRKLTVVNDEATGVVKISDSVLERLKGEISGEKKDPQPSQPQPEAAVPEPAAPPPARQVAEELPPPAPVPAPAPAPAVEVPPVQETHQFHKLSL